MVSLILIAIHEILSLGRDWWCHVTIDHATIWLLLWCTWVHVLVVDGFLHHRLAGWCWWAGSSVDGFLLLNGMLKDVGHL